MPVWTVEYYFIGESSPIPVNVEADDIEGAKESIAQSLKSQFLVSRHDESGLTLLPLSALTRIVVMPEGSQRSKPAR